MSHSQENRPVQKRPQTERLHSCNGPPSHSSETGESSMPVTKLRRLDNENDHSAAKYVSLVKQDEPCETATSELVSITELPHFDFTIDRLESTTVDQCLVVHVAGTTDDMETVSVELHGFWAQTPLSPGVRLRLFGHLDPYTNHCVVSDTRNFILVNPDVLVPCTSVVSGVYCRRKTLLQEKCRGGVDGGNLAMTLGTAVHRLFQSAVQVGTHVSEDWFRAEANASIFGDLSVLEELGALGLTPERFLTEMQPYLPVISKWINQFIVDRQPLSALVSCLSLYLHFFKGERSARIEAVRDIEENIWCPTYGIRGKIDLSLEVGVGNSRSSQIHHRNRIVPLELKTGKSTNGSDHQGQVLLYQLMISSLKPTANNGDTSDYSAQNGLLLYLKDGAAHSTLPVFHAIRGLVQLRNQFAAYQNSLVDGEEKTAEVIKPSGLPEFIDDRRLCGGCHHLLSCSLWNRSFEDGKRIGCSQQQQVVPEWFSAVVDHLSAADLEFYRRWTTWLHMEWNSAKRDKAAVSDVWNISASARESNGQALSSLIFDVQKCSFGESRSQIVLRKINIFYQNVFSDEPLKSCAFRTGDIVVLSNESRNHHAMFMGPITEISESSVTVVLDKAPRGQVRTDVYRVDKYESFASYQICLTNVLRLMVNTPTAAKLRSLIIEAKRPEFSTKLRPEELRKVKPIIGRTLNGQQIRAVLKGLLARDYMLIHGYPGSGKTSTISALVRSLLALGKSVLISAYTHSAVDNLLTKIVQAGDIDESKLLRLGSLSQMNSACRRLSIGEKLRSTPPEAMFDSLQNIYLQVPVVACTCLQASNHVLFGQRRFDVVIIDEATQSTDGAVIGALLAADRFVLVGDPMQLAPLVQNRRARAEGMNRSLFERLHKEDSAVVLTQQYRMNKELNRLSSTMVYGNKMNCGGDSVATATIRPSSNPIVTDSEWMKLCVSPDLCNSAVFVDTSKAVDDGSTFRCRLEGAGLRCNRGEAQLVSRIAVKLIEHDLSPNDIGVICVYRHQIELVRRCLHDVLNTTAAGVEIGTADTFQGRDKSVILVSFVWTVDTDKENESNQKSDLLSEERRLNVILTRAKHKLVLVGCRKSLQRHAPMAKLFELLRPDQISSHQTNIGFVLPTST